MPIESAGILGYRRTQDRLEVLLVHPGGPYFAKRDAGAWSIPKGLLDGEDPPSAALREFSEETGLPISGKMLSLGTIRQKGGKLVHAWAVEGDWDLADFRSNLFEMEWPPRSGETRSFPEADRAGWFCLEEAREKLIEAQHLFLNRLRDLLA